MRTPLYMKHVDLGGRMVEFAGYSMPVLYSSIIDEHMTTRNACTMFDVSHMGQIRIKGKNSTALLERMLPTRIDRLEPGMSMYSLFCGENGGVIDDIFLCMISSCEYYIVVNASTRQKDYNWILGHAMNDVTVVDESDSTFKIDVQGPESGEILNEILPGAELKNLERFHFLTTDYNGIELMIMQGGYTGEYGFEIYGKAEAAGDLWDHILEAGSAHGIKPAGLGARDSLRLEACLSLYGHELNEDISPVEAGLGWLVSSTHSFPGREILTRQKENGATRKMICLACEGNSVPRNGNTVLVDGREAGHVTSGTFSPVLGRGIAMALVKTELSDGNAEILIRNKKVKSIITPRPFYRYQGK